jgi:hypothetical protein
MKSLNIEIKCRIPEVRNAFFMSYLNFATHVCFLKTDKHDFKTIVPNSLPYYEMFSDIIAVCGDSHLRRSLEDNI